MEEACPLSEPFLAAVGAAFAAKVLRPAAMLLRTACAVHLEVLLHLLEFGSRLEEVPDFVVVVVVVVAVVAAHRIVPVVVVVVVPYEVVLVWGFVKGRLGAIESEGYVCTLVVVAGTNYLAGRTVADLVEVVAVMAYLGVGLHLNLHLGSFVVGIARAGVMRIGWKMKTVEEEEGVEEV